MIDLRVWFIENTCNLNIAENNEEYFKRIAKASDSWFPYIFSSQTTYFDMFCLKKD